MVVVLNEAQQRDPERRLDLPQGADGAADLYRAVGKQLKLPRERAGWTHKELGDRLGYGEDLISALERGRRTPQPELVEAADELLGAVGLLKATNHVAPPLSLLARLVLLLDFVHGIRAEAHRPMSRAYEFAGKRFDSADPHGHNVDGDVGVMSPDGHKPPAIARRHVLRRVVPGSEMDPAVIVGGIGPDLHLAVRAARWLVRSHVIRIGFGPGRVRGALLAGNLGGVRVPAEFAEHGHETDAATLPHGRTVVTTALAYDPVVAPSRPHAFETEHGRSGSKGRVWVASVRGRRRA